MGNEGAGVVVAAGASDAAQALLGKTVAALGGAMYSQYRCVQVERAWRCRTAPPPAEAPRAFVNPLTALGMVETMRREGHTALVHTAAASNFGQMLNRICIKDASRAGEHRAQRRASRISCAPSAPRTCAIRARPPSSRI